MIISTQKVVHNADDIKKYRKLGIDQEPPKELVGFLFHMRDVKHLTQHILPEDDDIGLPELSLVHFYDGETVPVIEQYESLAEQYITYNTQRDEEFKRIIDKQ